MNASLTFDRWPEGLHSEEKQRRKIAAAAKAELTPVKVDREDRTGVFSGESGIYETTLVSCSCKSFAIERLPCKHMYRLAWELGSFDIEDVKTDPAKIRSPAQKVTPKRRAAAYDKCVALIESYPEQTRQEIHGILYERYCRREYISEDISILQQPLADGIVEKVSDPKAIIQSNTQKRTVEGMLAAGFTFPDDVKATKKARYEWCLLHPDVACSYVYPDLCVVRPANELEIANRSVYTYLNTKYGYLNEYEQW